MAQTAVSWLIEQVNGYSYPIPYNQNIKIDIPKEIIEQAKAMEKEQSHNYADFCVRCDRDQMKLLDFNDYMKIYTNGL